MRRSPLRLASLAVVAVLLAGAGVVARVAPDRGPGGASDELALGQGRVAETEEVAPDVEGPVAPEPPVVVVPPRDERGPEPASLPEVAPLPFTVRAQLGRLLTSDIWPRTDAVGVAVLDAEGRSVLAVEARRPLLPASTQKLVTAAAVLTQDGPDATRRTVVRASTPPTTGGTVVGDLVLIGGGDPVLSTDDFRRYIYPARPQTRIEALAEAVAAAGVRRVLGDIVGSGAAFADEPEAPGWKQVYLSELDARNITALTVDAGLDVTVHSEEPVELTLEASPAPEAAAARALWRALVAEGITIEGTSRAGDALVESVPVAEQASPPLRELLQHTVERSDNHLADTLFRDLSTPLGRSTWRASAIATVHALDELGIDVRGLRLADGSGLSRHNRLSAATLSQLLHLMATGPHADAWADVLAVAGSEGTLRRRFVGHVAEGGFAGKTGTLDDVLALAGTVYGPDGRPAYHLAVLGNEAVGAERSRIRQSTDVLVEILARAARCGSGAAVPSELAARCTGPDPTDQLSPAA